MITTSLLSQAPGDIAAALQRIRENYGRGCLHFTGEPLPEASDWDRRGDPRQPAEIPFYLAPLACAEHGFQVLLEPAVLALTRDLSSQGIGFQCDVPIGARYYLAEFDSGEGEPVALILQVRWRRRRSPHCYLGGAQVLQVCDRESLAE
jgi:hypothetical protein